jgi:hypothetical protein
MKVYESLLEAKLAALGFALLCTASKEIWGSISAEEYSIEHKETKEPRPRTASAGRKVSKEDLSVEDENDRLDK